MNEWICQKCGAVMDETDIAHNAGQKAVCEDCFDNWLWNDKDEEI